MNKLAKQLILACAVPVFILLGMSALPVYTLLNGQEIVLQTAPVDPSDPFRGDYVTLRYKAEEVPKKLVEEAVLNEVEKGRYNFTVYVLLQQKDGVHTPISVLLKKPNEGLYLKGKLNYIGGFPKEQEIAYIQYTLDKYFLEDNTGLEWEKLAAKGDILARVKVKNGYAYLVGIEEKK